MNIFWAILGVAIVAVASLFVVAIVNAERANQSCKDSGGVFVRTYEGLRCIPR